MFIPPAHGKNGKIPISCPRYYPDILKPYPSCRFIVEPGFIGDNISPAESIPSRPKGRELVNLKPYPVPEIMNESFTLRSISLAGKKVNTA